jgi:hypothetical protein
MLSHEVMERFSLLEAKVDEVAARAGIPENSRRDLEAALASLPSRDRRYLQIVLQASWSRRPLLPSNKPCS